MSSNFDPKVIFHNSDKNTTVSVTVVDSVLNALTVNEEVSLTFNYEGKDVDQEGYVTFENRNTVLKVISDLLDADLMFDRPSILKPLYNYDRFYGELISSPFVGKISGIRHIRTVWTISRSKDFDDTRLQTKNEVITVDRGDLTRAQVIFNSEEEIYIKVKYVAEYTDGTGRHEVELTSFPKLCNAKITKPIRAANIAILDENENEVYQAKYYEKRKIAGAVEGLCYKIGLRLNNWYETTLEGNDVPLGGTPENATRVIVKVYNRNPDDPVLPARYGEKFTNLEADVKFKEACDLGKSLCLAGKDYFILGKADSDGNNLATVNSSTTDTYDQYFALDSEKGEIEYVEENRTLKIKPFKLWQSPYFSINSFCYLVVRIYRGDAGVEQHYKTIKLDLISSMLEKENLIHTPVDNFKHVLNVNKPYELSKHMNTITLNLDDSILNDIHESTTWEIVAMKKTYKPEDYKSFDNSSYPARPAIPRLFSLYRFNSSVFKKTLGYSVDDVMVLEDLKNKVPSNYNYMDKGWWAPREYKTVLPSPSVDSIADSLGAGNFYCTGDSFCRVFGINNTGIDFYNSLVNTNTSNITANPGDLIMSFRLEDGSIQVTHAQTGRLFIRSLDSTHCCHVVIIKDRDTSEILHTSVHYEKDSSNPSNTYNGDGLAGYVPITRNGSTTNLTYYHVDSRRNIEITCNKFENLSTPFNLTSSFNTPKKRYEEFKRMNNLGSVPVDELVKGYVGLPIDSPYLQAAALGKLDLDNTYSKGEFNLYIKVTLNIRNAVSGMESSPVFIPLEIGKMNKYRGFNRNDHFVNTVWKHDFLASLAVNPDTDVMYNNKFLHKTFNPTTSVLNPLGHPMSTIHDFRTMKDTSISQCMAITPSLFLVKRKQEFKTIVFDSIEQLAYYFESLTKYSEPTKESYDKKASGQYSDFDVALSRVDRRRMITIKTSKNLFDKLNYTELLDTEVRDWDFYSTSFSKKSLISNSQMEYMSTEHTTYFYSDSNCIFKEAYTQTYEDILEWLKHYVSSDGELDQQAFFIDVYDVQGAPTRPKFREAIVVTISKEMVKKGIYFQGHDGILNSPIPLLSVDRAKSFPKTDADSVALGPVSLSYALELGNNHHKGRDPYSMTITEFNAKLGSYTADWEEGYQGCVADISPSGLMLDKNESYFKLSSQVDLFSSNFEYYGLIQFKDCTENSLLGFKGDFVLTKDGYKKGQEFVDPSTGALYYCYGDFNALDTGGKNVKRCDSRVVKPYNTTLSDLILSNNPPFVKVSDHSLNKSSDDTNNFYIMPEEEYRKYYKSSLPTYVSLLSYLNLILPAHEGLIFDPTLGDKNKDWIDINGSDEGDGTMNKYRVFALPNEYSGDVVYESELISDDVEVSNVKVLKSFQTLYLNLYDDDPSTSYFNRTATSYTWQSMFNAELSSVNSSFSYSNSRFYIGFEDLLKITTKYGVSDLQDLILNFGFPYSTSYFHNFSSCTSLKVTFYSLSEEFRCYNNGSYVGNYGSSGWARNYVQAFYIYNKTDNTIKGFFVSNPSNSVVDTSSVTNTYSTYKSLHNFTSDMTLYEETFSTPKEIVMFKLDMVDTANLYRNHVSNNTYSPTEYLISDVDFVTLNSTGSSNNIGSETIKKTLASKTVKISKYDNVYLKSDTSLSEFYVTQVLSDINVTVPNTNGNSGTLLSYIQRIRPSHVFGQASGKCWIVKTNEFMEKVNYPLGLQEFHFNFVMPSYGNSLGAWKLKTGKGNISFKISLNSGNQINFKLYNNGTLSSQYNPGWNNNFEIVISLVSGGKLLQSFFMVKQLESAIKSLETSPDVINMETFIDLNSYPVGDEVEIWKMDGVENELYLIIGGCYTSDYLYTFSSYTRPNEQEFITKKPPLTIKSNGRRSKNLVGRAIAGNYDSPYMVKDSSYDDFYMGSSTDIDKNALYGLNSIGTIREQLNKIQPGWAPNDGSQWVMSVNEFMDAIGYSGGLQDFYQSFGTKCFNNENNAFVARASKVRITISKGSNRYRISMYIDDASKPVCSKDYGYSDWTCVLSIVAGNELVGSILWNKERYDKPALRISDDILNKYETMIDLSDYDTREITIFEKNLGATKDVRIVFSGLWPNMQIFQSFSQKDNTVISGYYPDLFTVGKPSLLPGESGTLPTVTTEEVQEFEFSPSKNYAVKSTFPYKYLEEYFKAYDKYQSKKYFSSIGKTITINRDFYEGLGEVMEDLGTPDSYITRFCIGLEDYLAITKYENLGDVLKVMENIDYDGDGVLRTTQVYTRLERNNNIVGNKLVLLRERDDSMVFRLRVKNSNGYVSLGGGGVINLFPYGRNTDSYIAIIRVRLANGSDTALDKTFIYYNEAVGQDVDEALKSYTDKVKEKFPSFVTDFKCSEDKELFEIDLGKELDPSNLSKDYLYSVDIKYIASQDLERSRSYTISSTATSEMLDTTIFGGWFKFKNKNYNNFIYMSTRPVLWVKDLKTIASANIAHPRQSIIRIGLKHYYVRLVTDRFYPDDDCCLDPVTLAGQQTSQPDFDTFNDPWCLNFRESLITPNIMSLCMIANKRTLYGGKEAIKTPIDYCLKDITTLYYNNGDANLTPTHNYMIYSSNLSKRNAFFNEHGTVMYSATPYKSPYHCKPGNDGKYLYSYIDDANLNIAKSDVTYNLHISQPAFEYGSDEELFGKNELVFGQPVRMSGFYLKSDSKDDRLIFTYVKSENNKINDEERRTSNGPRVYDPNRGTELAFPGLSLRYDIKDKIPDNEMNHFQDYHPVHIVLEAIEEKDLPIYNIKDSLKELLNVNGTRVNDTLGSLVKSDGVARTGRFINNIDYSNFADNKRDIKQITTYREDLEIGVKKIRYDDGHVVPYISNFKPSSELPGLSTYYNLVDTIGIDYELQGSIGAYSRTYDTLTNEISEYGQWMSQFRRTWGTLDVDRVISGLWGGYRMREYSDAKLKLYDRWSGVGYLGTISSTKSLDKQTNGVNWKQNYGVYNTLTSQLEKILRHRLISSNTIREDDKTYIPVCHVFYYKGKIVLIPRETSFNIYEPDMYGFNYTKDMEHLEYGRSKPIDRTTRDIGRVKVGLNVLDPFLPYLSNDRSMHSLQELVRDIIPIYVKK